MNKIDMDMFFDQLNLDGVGKDQLEHYGVPGMKWGVRKGKGTAIAGTKAASREGAGSPHQKKVRAAQKELREKTAAVKSTTKKYDVDSRRAKRISKAIRDKSGKTRTAHMSDKQLQDAINRMRMEQQWSQMNQQNSRVLSAGKKIMENVVQPALYDVGRNTLKSALVPQIEKATGLTLDSKKKKEKEKE